MSEILTAADFRDKVDQEFTIDFNDDAVPDVTLTLASCDDLTPHDHPKKQRDPFSLVFHGPPGAALQQMSYTLNNAAMGKLDIFLVPIAGDEEKVCYQAVFN